MSTKQFYTTYTIACILVILFVHTIDSQPVVDDHVEWTAPTDNADMMRRQAKLGTRNDIY